MEHIRFGRFAFVAAIFSIVLGLYWPHVKERSLTMLVKTLVDPLGVFFNRERLYSDHDIYPVDESFYQHPKLTGQTFVKKVMGQASTIGSLGHSGPNLPAATWPKPGAIRGRPINVASHYDRLTSMFFVFTATVVILTLIIIINRGKSISRSQANDGLLEPHFRRETLSGVQYQSGVSEKRKRKQQVSGDRSSRTRDLLTDKREGDLAVTIKLLIMELERQKLAILESLSEENGSLLEGTVGMNCANEHTIDGDTPATTRFRKSEPDLSRA